MWQLVFLITLLLSSVSSQLFDEDLHASVLDAETCQRHRQEANNFQFYDASFRIPQSILLGGNTHFGNYYQCLDIRQELSSEDYIEGKHCMMTVALDKIQLVFPNISLPFEQMLQQQKFYQPMMNMLRNEAGGSNLGIPGQELFTYKLGVCIPKSCGINEGLSFLLLNIDAEDLPVQCRLPGDKPFKPADYAAIAIFSTIGLLTILSTAYELYHVFYKKDPKNINQVLACGSLYYNTSKLFTFKSNPTALHCLDGIRSLSILWVVYGHTIIGMVFSGMVNFLEGVQWFVSAEGVFLQSAHISVDSFLMLSGMLLVYTTAPKMTRSSLFKGLHLYYINRILRLFPLLATGILLQATLFHHIYDGANWEFEAEQVQFCRDYWWSALFYIQNYLNPVTECLPHTWYLAVDMQLHILSPLALVWVLGSRRRSGWIGLSTVTLLTLVSTIIISFTQNLVNFPGIEGENLRYKRWFYNNTLTRAPVFCIGMLYGYFLHIHRKERLVLPRTIVVIGWAAAAAVASVVFYNFNVVNQLEYDNQLVRNLTNSFQRPAFVVALGWLVVACVHGYGGPVNWFLSWTLWKFFARISYAMYIFHYPIQFILASSAFAPTYFSPLRYFLAFLLDIAITVLVSVIACIVIDAPLSTLQRTLIGKLSGSGKKKPKNANEESMNTNNQLARDQIKTAL